MRDIETIQDSLLDIYQNDHRGDVEYLFINSCLSQYISLPSYKELASSYILYSLQSIMTDANNPHVLDMWYLYTGEANSSIPFCSSLGFSECGMMFANETGLEYTVDPLTVRLTCQTQVSVPDYYLDLASSLFPESITHDSNGRMIFVARVCGCRYARGLTGDHCTPNEFGYVLVVAFASIALWLLVRLVRAVQMLFNGQLGSRRKQLLVILAALQHVGQIMWLIGWLDVHFIIQDREIMQIYFANLGFTLASLFMFMFICGLASQTSAYLRMDAKGLFETRLKWIERIFAVLPFVVAIVTWLLVADMGLKSRLGLVLFQSMIMVSASGAFAFLINVVDKRVRRLLPPTHQHGTVTQSRSVVTRFFRFTTCRRRTIGRRAKHDDTAELLIASSKRLRRMATSLSVYMLCYAIFGGLYIVVENLEETPTRVLRVPHFLIWELVLSSIPTVGIEGLSMMKMNPVSLRVFTNKVAAVKPKSSFVGTLTS